MNCFQWLRSFVSDNKLKEEINELNSQISHLKVMKDEYRIKEERWAQRREVLVCERDALKKLIEKMEVEIVMLKNDLETKDSEVASFADEIVRLKKLIEQSRDKGTPPVGSAIVEEAKKKRDGSVDKSYPRGKGDDRTR